MPKEGQVWPLQLVYLVLLVLAILGSFVAPAASPSAPTAWDALSKNAGWFLVGAFIAGLVLYIPVFAAWWRAGGTIWRLLKPASGSIAAWIAVAEPALAAIGDPQKPGAEPNTVIGRLEAIRTQIEAVARTDLPDSIAARVQAIQANTEAIGRPEVTASVLGRLESIQAQIGTIGRLDLPNSVLARLQALQVRADAVGDAITPGTVLHRLATSKRGLMRSTPKSTSCRRRRNERRAETEAGRCAGCARGGRGACVSPAGCAGCGTESAGRADCG